MAFLVSGPSFLTEEKALVIKTKAVSLQSRVARLEVVGHADYGIENVVVAIRSQIPLPKAG